MSQDFASYAKKTDARTEVGYCINDVTRYLEALPDNHVHWAWGRIMAAKHRSLVGRGPAKELAKKTNGSGSHDKCIFDPTRFWDEGVALYQALGYQRDRQLLLPLAQPPGGVYVHLDGVYVEGMQGWD